MTCRLFFTRWWIPLSKTSFSASEARFRASTELALGDLAQELLVRRLQGGGALAHQLGEAPAALVQLVVQPSAVGDVGQKSPMTLPKRPSASSTEAALMSDPQFAAVFALEVAITRRGRQGLQAKG